MVYVLMRIRDGVGWRKGAVIHAHSPCKGWRVLYKYYDGHDGAGLR